jgi:N-acyl-D-aspartate/D-glutamate deacylase
MAYDLLLRNAKLVDGTGSPWRKADIAIAGGRIASIGAIGRDAKANDIVDVHNRFVTPGFVNVHSHLDFSILAEPEMQSAVLQGITTELGGQCGQSIAPMDPNKVTYVREFYRNHWHGMDLDWRWTSFGDFLGRLEREGISINFGMQVGHQTLRLNAMGFACRPATREEVLALEKSLGIAMKEGAFGLSCGLQWAPSFFCETDELVALGKIVAQFGGFVAFHMRSEGDKLLEAVAEVIEVGERADVSVQISHLKAAGQRNFGKVHGALRMVASARDRGVDVLVDTQPYGSLDRKYAAENMWMRSSLPPWILADAGGFGEVQARLKDPKFRETIRLDIEQKRSPHWHNRIVDCMLEDVGWEGLVLGSSESPEFIPFVGLSVAEIARRRDMDPYETYFDILQEEKVASSGLYFMMDPDDVRSVVTSEYTMPQVDAAPRHTHPRRYGCFAHYLSNYVRRGGAFRLEEAVRRMTSFPAARMGLTDRGLIREGCWADLCVLDLDNLEDHTDFNNIKRPPTGIEHVLVNGVFVIKNGIHTGARPGKALRRN